MKKTMNKFIYGALIAGSVAVSSCTTDDLNPSLEQSKEAANAIETVGDLEGILKGTYEMFTQSDYYGRDYLVTNEVRTPNTWSNGNSGRFTTQATFKQTANGLFIWDPAYETIASANVIIGTDLEALSGVGGAAPDLDYARHLVGQAYAIRALAHFDLLKTYGQQHVGGNLGVPYITEFKGDNEIPARNTIDENIASILADFNTAYEMMGDFGMPNTYMGKYAAPALASRAAVYFASILDDQSMWAVARDQAKLVIDSGEYQIVPADQYVASFTDGGTDVNSIFELAFSGTDNLSSDSMEFIYLGCTYGDISVTDEAFNSLYESTDDVRTNLLDTEDCDGDIYLRGLKFSSRNHNIIVIRYEEVVLNYAEALFELGEGDPLTWLNMIPENRNADTYASVTKDNIIEERREEFIFEGLYYWDLLRTGQDIVRTETSQPINIPYGDSRLAYPIPNAELDANSNIEQNPGY
jgi:hypothetical protein